MKLCIVSYIDPGGIRHAAEVQADSMYEAAAAALESFYAHDCAPGSSTELEVQVRTAVTHTLSVKKLQDWANQTAVSPRDSTLKQRIKAALTKQVRSRKTETK